VIFKKFTKEYLPLVNKSLCICVTTAQTKLNLKMTLVMFNLT